MLNLRTSSASTVLQEVFAFLSDFANIPKWNYFVLEVRRLSESPIGIGTSY